MPARLSLIAALSLPLLVLAAEDEGWQTLYNGKDLTNFKTEGNWIPQDEGVLHLKPRDGEKGWKRYGSYLWVDKQVGDFSFDFEFKYPKGGNSGFFFRCKDLEDPVSRGIEVQILDSYGKKKLGQHDMGGVIRTVGPSKNMAKPAGEWNRMIVTVRKNQLTVVLNAEQIVDLNLAESKMKDRPAKGWLGIQDHGQPFFVRNLKLKEL